MSRRGGGLLLSGLLLRARGASIAFGGRSETTDRPSPGPMLTVIVRLPESSSTKVTSWLPGGTRKPLIGVVPAGLPSTSTGVGGLQRMESWPVSSLGGSGSSGEAEARRDGGRRLGPAQPEHPRASAARAARQALSIMGADVISPRTGSLDRRTCFCSILPRHDGTPSDRRRTGWLRAGRRRAPGGGYGPPPGGGGGGFGGPPPGGGGGGFGGPPPGGGGFGGPPGGGGFGGPPGGGGYGPPPGGYGGPPMPPSPPQKKGPNVGGSSSASAASASCSSAASGSEGSPS